MMPHYRYAIIDYAIADTSWLSAFADADIFAAFATPPPPITDIIIISPLIISWLPFRQRAMS
jgi:Sec-independent protein secretion pathway component TatC